MEFVAFGLIKMKITVQSATKANDPAMQTLAKQAHKAKLYMKGSTWMLKDYLKDCFISQIVVAFDKDVPVGVTVKTKVGKLLMTYVLPKYRNMKIGTNLLKRLSGPSKYSKGSALAGIEGSDIFYKKAFERIN